MRNIALPTAGLIVIENNKLLENIEFHINVAKKYNKKEFKKGNQYHFSYETKCLFDDEELNILREKLNIIILKMESGYEIFFKN